MMIRCNIASVFLFFIFFSGYAVSEDKVAGEARYNKRVVIATDPQVRVQQAIRKYLEGKFLTSNQDWKPIEME